jgi:DNA-binding transcriptional ArsR family regulator
VNPEPFLQLDRVIHEKGRLAIMSMLAASPELSFTELRDALTMTDGNLTTHIRALQQEGYVAVAKSYRKNRPLTTCSLTSARPLLSTSTCWSKSSGKTRQSKKNLNKLKPPWSFTL